MAGRRADVLDVREMVRRFKLGQKDRQIARELKAGRHTIGNYRKLAATEGWLDRSDLPSGGEIELRVAALQPQQPLGPRSTVEAHRVRVVELRAKGVEVMALWQILREQHGFGGSYTSVRRYVRRLEARLPDAFTRVETGPGEEAQVDFGFAGEFLDPAVGQKRRAWVFVMTLSFSRHQYAEIVFDQKVETWVALHVRAFEFFGAVPRKIVPDNLKAAIVRACFHDPQIQRAYRELAEHYDFTIAPCRPRTPRHKGKVESGVRYVKRNALAGREFTDVVAGNEHLKRWIAGTAGTRDHGTTHEAPLLRFEVERPALAPLPGTRYEPAVWKEVKLHPDCHISFEKSYYSAPHRLIGQQLLVRATRDRVEIYYRHERVASHSRAPRPGTRATNAVHYPPTLLAGFMATPVRLREQAAGVGASTSELIGQMLAEKPVNRLRAAQGILNFVKRYGPARLEAACRRALAFGESTYRTVSSILRPGLEYTPHPPEAQAQGPVPASALFARSVHEIAQGLN
jgi:transposase